MKAVSKFLTGKPKAATKGDLASFDAGLVGLAAVAAVAAVAAYVFQPAQRFVALEHLFLGGMLLIMGLLPATVFRRRDPPRVYLWMVAGVIASGAVVLFFAANDAVDQSEWNDQRCIRVQSAMLHPTGRTRTDLPNLFTALGCQPQGSAPRDPTWTGVRAGGPPPTRKAVAAHERFMRQAADAEVELNSVSGR
ncbi:hypothetical protein U1872_10370 [Sphingomonas sp. RB3P16]|uniref:hypothetical protein n=1 Tax=Parasphingomonas frigoris TaxID=3096163 RepID=UPI002FC70566